MLGTIKVPKNLRLLSERLPKSNYGKKSEKKSQNVSAIGDQKLQSI